MPHEFRITRSVEFSETDMAGIVHYSNFFKYMEYCEHAFFRSLGHSIVTQSVDPPVGWPRVHAECDYMRPLKFEDTVEVQLLVAEKRSRSLKYQFRFWLPIKGERTEIARGNLVVVCVRRQEDGSMKATDIPDELANMIDVAPAEALG